MFLYKIKIIASLIVSVSFLISCSAASYVDRYKSSKVNQDESSKKDITAENINNQKENNTYDQNYIIEKLNSFAGSNFKKQKLIDGIIEYLNTPYKYGGNSKNGIDCSAFVQQVFQNSLNINLPRTTKELFNLGKRIENKMDLKFGDLIFFDTTNDSFPGHVGIYLGEDLFAHASVSQGVTISTLIDEYFQDKYVSASRLTQKKQ